jgi:S1-C subfamily serine protease
MGLSLSPSRAGRPSVLAAATSLAFWLLAGLARAADAPAPSLPAAMPSAPAAAPAPAAPASATTSVTLVPGVENSVVKIFSTMRYPDPFRPWAKQAPREASGSGVILPGHRILTNAHVVLYASQIEVQGYQSGDRLPAEVVAVAPGIDLAVLKLDDESFFDTRPPLAFADALPAIKDPVMVYGYPTGGTGLSITKGIVSRIEFVEYNFPTTGLRIQIDAAINPGNSGGPALAGDKMIGLAFSRLGGAENIGYIIPCEEIELFLKAIANGPYVGKPAMFDELQTLENPALRKFLQLDKSVSGTVVHAPASSDPAYPLKQWDVITKIGDTPVDDEGMVKVSDGLRVNFLYLVQKITHDGKVPLTVIRNGKEVSLELPVQADNPLLIPDLQGAYPSYFIYGPLVFSTATADFVSRLAASNEQWSDMLSMLGSPLIARRGDKPAFDGEQLVVVASPFFPDNLVIGYGDPMTRVVKTVNGIPIKNLKQLVETLRDLQDDFVTFEFYGRDSETLVFPRKAMLASTDDILNDNGIRSQGSADVLPVWNAKPAK